MELFIQETYFAKANPIIEEFRMSISQFNLRNKFKNLVILLY